MEKIVKFYKEDRATDYEIIREQYRQDFLSFRQKREREEESIFSRFQKSREKEKQRM